MQLATPVHFETPRLPALVKGSRDADEVEITLLCADVVSFTEMTNRLGDIAALSVMRRVADTVRKATKLDRGELLEIRGDAFLLAFASPRDAGRCALRLMRSLAHDSDTGEPIHVRIALHTGTAVRDGGGYFGRAVILAHRLLSQAASDQVAVTSSVADRLSALWQTRIVRGGCFQPKGFQSDIHYVVLEDSGCESI